GIAEEKLNAKRRRNAQKVFYRAISKIFQGRCVRSSSDPANQVSDAL
ncbi:21933_t:CDS:1, partial [Dentiscutata erythropus]